MKNPKYNQKWDMAIANRTAIRNDNIFQIV